MKTKTEITNRTIRFNESLRPSTKLHILYACCAVSALIILIFVYRPLIIKLHNAANRLHEVETELLNQHSDIAAFKKPDVKGKIISQNEVPAAIAELTEKGRELGLNFSSISQQQLQQTTQAGIRNLPISFTIESNYKNLGQFLTYVEEHGFAEVESLYICPKENNPSKLNVELVLNLYMEIENATL